MKTKAAIVVLILVAVALAAAVALVRERAKERQEADAAYIRQLSNDCNQTSAKLAAQIEVNSVLTNNLQARMDDLDKSSRELEQALTNTAKAQAEAAAKAKEVELAQAEITKRDARISDLEAQNSLLDKQANELRSAIANRETLIAETQRKLNAAIGDRNLLLKELKRLQSEKSELERQFNDVVVLRDQLQRLKEELAVAKRIEWLKKGLYGGQPMKGAERLQRGFTPPALPKPSYNLDVEVKRDGSVKVVSPTNAPPAKP